MPHAHAVVDGIRAITATPAAGPAPTKAASTAIHFQGGRTAQLDMGSPQAAVWAQVLESLRQEKEPAYVEVDPRTNVITRLLCPLTVRVTAINPVQAGTAVEVELEVSQARHLLRRSNPDFPQLLAALQTAQGQGTAVLVTETLNDHEIIDVRPVTPPFVAATTAPPALGVTGAPLVPPSGPAAAVAPSVVTPAQAVFLFNLVNAQTCNPLTAAAPCIPFLYPDDGCWGRAHEMCRLIIGQGEVPEKVWIYGSLDVATRNHPACMVSWGWHVAPTLLVKDNGTTEIQVIDPALFAVPVPQATWFGVQGDPAATTYPTAADIFLRTAVGVTSVDPTYVQTNRVLARYRRDLMLRSAGPDGPPPYAHCP